MREVPALVLRPFRTLLVFCVLAAAVTACGTGGVRNRDDSPRPTTRPADFTKCPLVSLRPVPASYELSKRELLSLHGNHMGRVLTYRAGRRSIQVYSGTDLYDSLEDLDLTARSMWIRGHLFSVSTTRLAPEMVIAVLGGKAADHPPCDNIGVLTRHVPKPTTRKYLEDVHISNN